LTSIGIRSAEVSGDDKDPNLPSFSALTARMVFWYRGAKRLLRQELAAIMSKASPDSRLDPNSQLPWPGEPGVAPVMLKCNKSLK
jgi:hypothetical protein